MSITPRDFPDYSDPIMELYRSLGEEIAIEIAKRLKAGYTVDADNVMQWQIDKLNQAHQIDGHFQKRISELSGKSEKEIQAMFKKAGYDIIKGIDSELKQIVNTGSADWSFIDSVIQSYSNQVFLDVGNFVNQTLLTTNYGTGAIKHLYQRIINQTVMSVASGVKTFDQALADTIIKWRKKGLLSSFIDKGGNRWSAERYVNTVLRSTLGRIFDELRMSRMEEFGLDLVLMSSKPDARPACSLCQGTVMTMKETGYGQYKSIYEFGYGEPAGVRGINCGHMLFPWAEGMTNTQVQYDSDEAVQRFKTIQQQRGYEAGIRDTKEKINIAEALGNDKLIKQYKTDLRNQWAQLRQFVEENDLVRDYARERVIT